MKYSMYEGQIKEQKLNVKILLVVAMSFIAVLGMSSIASADNARDIALEGNPNCVGKFASDHAKRSDDRGLKGILEEQRHTWLADNYNGGDRDMTTGEEMRAMVAACKDNRAE